MAIGRKPEKRCGGSRQWFRAARRARKKLKDEDKTRLDSSVSALENALRDGNEYRIKTVSEDLDTILRSVGTYTSAPEGENDGGYAISSYREVDPRLGSMAELASGQAGRVLLPSLPGQWLQVDVTPC